MVGSTLCLFFLQDLSLLAVGGCVGCGFSVSLGFSALAKIGFE